MVGVADEVAMESTSRDWSGGRERPGAWSSRKLTLVNHSGNVKEIN